MALLHY